MQGRCRANIAEEQNRQARQKHWDYRQDGSRGEKAVAVAEPLCSLPPALAAAGEGCRSYHRGEEGCVGVPLHYFHVPCC